MLLTLFLSVSTFAADIPKGKNTDANPALCSDEAGVKDIIDNDWELLKSELRINAAGMGFAHADENPLGRDCVILALSFSEGKDMRRAQKKIGVTYKGYLLRLETIGVITAGGPAKAPKKSKPRRTVVHMPL
jgi:hypothetical protein